MSVLSVVGLFACGGATRPPGPPVQGSAGAGSGTSTSDVSPAPSTTRPPAAPIALPGGLPAGLLGPRGVLLIGDLQGTREIPAFVARVVATAAAAQPVVLGLEVSTDLLPSLDRFLASDGGRAARDAFLRDRWWRLPSQDGRQSVAMLDLIDAVRALRAAGAPIELYCFDAPPADINDGERREDGMALHLIALRTARPDAALIVYAATMHVRKQPSPLRPGFAWLAMRLVRAGIAMVSLDVRHADGTAWLCLSPAECGPSFATGTDDPPGFHLERSQDGAYDGWFHVGAISASPPAAFPALAASLPARIEALYNDPAARRARALRAYRDKDYARCADELGHLAEPRADDAYSHACCLARTGDKDRAFDRLKFAIDHGFKDWKGANKDPDLKSLHDDPRWAMVKKP